MKNILLFISLVFLSACIQKANATVEVSPGVVPTVVSLTDGATISWNAAQGNNYRVTIAGNRTMANPTGLATGQIYSLAITQDGTGTRLLNWGSAYRFVQDGGNEMKTSPYLSTAANAVDLVLFYSDGTYLNFLSISKDVSPQLYKPTGLTATTNVTGHVNLAWTDTNAGETGYVVSEDGNPVATTAANATSYSRVVAAGTHNYVVTAIHNTCGGTFADGTSSESATVSGTSL